MAILSGAAGAPRRSPMPIKVLLADDHRLVRESLCKLLSEDPELEVVGDAGDARSALALAKRQQPDVVLLDVSMPELNGLDGIRLFAREMPSVRVCMLTMHSSDSYVLEAIRLGAKGYLLKSALSNVKLAFKSLFECIDYPGLADASLPPEQYYLSLSRLDLLPTLHEQRDLRLTSYQLGELSRRYRLEPAPGPACAHHPIQLHGF